nr:hypothetical protein [Eubacterium sp.]
WINKIPVIAAALLVAVITVGNNGAYARAGVSAGALTEYASVCVAAADEVTFAEDEVTDVGDEATSAEDDMTAADDYEDAAADDEGAAEDDETVIEDEESPKARSIDGDDYGIASWWWVLIVAIVSSVSAYSYAEYRRRKSDEI